jgi:co-chaperonin GroES (HSP10)
MRMTLLSDNILIKPLHKIETNMREKGLITIDPMRDARVKRGQVAFAGPGRLTKKGFIVKTDVEVGNIVWYLGNTGNFVRIDDEEYQITSGDNLLCVETN